MRYYYKEKENKYKIELIKDLEDGEITFYTQGEFTGLCKGPHIPNTVIKAVIIECCRCILEEMKINLKIYRFLKKRTK